MREWVFIKRKGWKFIDSKKKSAYTINSENITGSVFYDYDYRSIISGGLVLHHRM
jgi:hypothetical protein